VLLFARCQQPRSICFELAWHQLIARLHEYQCNLPSRQFILTICANCYDPGTMPITKYYNKATRIAKMTTSPIDHEPQPEPFPEHSHNYLDASAAKQTAVAYSPSWLILSWTTCPAGSACTSSEPSWSSLLTSLSSQITP
jgi:hypothetical protein